MNKFKEKNILKSSNMKAVAYMLDTKVWEEFKNSANKDSSKAE